MSREAYAKQSKLWKSVGPQVGGTLLRAMAIYDLACSKFYGDDESAYNRLKTEAVDALSMAADKADIEQFASAIELVLTLKQELEEKYERNN